LTAKKTSRKRAAPLPVPARFFTSAGALRQWLERHHGRAGELWIGFYRKDSGKGGITYAEALDAALCFGWIDGIRKKLDEVSYVNRFTPRRPGSIWSTVNVRHVERLRAAGLMRPAGLDAYDKRDPARSGIYSFEQRPRAFPKHHEATFKAAAAAWAHFSAQPPGYQRLGIWFVMSAKRDETQARRLKQLIDAHSEGTRIGVLFGQTGPAPTARKGRPPTPKTPGPGPKTPVPRPKTR
jgi:uncharacterized protein YdeI (YjbR/CyaY-like superfamily)